MTFLGYRSALSVQNVALDTDLDADLTAPQLGRVVKFSFA